METISNDMGAIWAGALIVVYLTATGIVLLIGAARVSASALALHFAVLAALAAVTWLRAVPRWLRLWAPLLLLLFLYSEIPLLIRAAGHDRFFDMNVIQWERGLFGGQPSMAWAAHFPSRLLSELLHAAYLTYYAIIFTVPVGLYLTAREADFGDAVFVLMLTFVVCCLCYIAFPVAGPRYLWGGTGPGGPVRRFVVWLLEARSSRGTAFPSSHVAVAVTQSILAIRYFGRRGLVVAALTVALALGAVYGGFHYAIDVLAGLDVGLLVAVAGLQCIERKRVRAVHANASAPTYP
jgi:membrane-associated phospholipid phosphatase